MKTNKINQLESFARSEFQSRTEFTAPDDWQDKVITEIKRCELKQNLESQMFIQPRIVWRFAAVAVAAATLICLTLYLALPDYTANENSTNEFAFDNFDSYVETIAQL